MSDLLWDKFQNSVDEVLTRHKSILDVLTKLQESSAKINRAVVKSATDCGCIKIDSSKQELPKGTSYKEASKYMDSHLRGMVCEVCNEKIQEEIGKNLFYFAALCNSLDINLYDVLIKEHNRIDTLGKYSLY